MDKDWVTRHSGTIGHLVARHSVNLARQPLGTGLHGHWGARHSVAPSCKALSTILLRGTSFGVQCTLKLPVLDCVLLKWITINYSGLQLKPKIYFPVASNFLHTQWFDFKRTYSFRSCHKCCYVKFKKYLKTHIYSLQMAQQM